MNIFKNFLKKKRKPNHFSDNLIVEINTSLKLSEEQKNLIVSIVKENYNPDRPLSNIAIPIITQAQIHGCIALQQQDNKITVFI